MEEERPSKGEKAAPGSKDVYLKRSKHLKRKGRGLMEGGKKKKAQQDRVTTFVKGKGEKKGWSNLGGSKGQIPHFLSVENQPSARKVGEADAK